MKEETQYKIKHWIIVNIYCELVYLLNRIGIKVLSRSCHSPEHFNGK